MKTQVAYVYRVGATEPERIVSVGGDFSLLQLQKFVGGYIELVPGIRPYVAYCNEEGRLKGLPVNALASRKYGQELVGDVVQIKREEL
jgi:hypothetical protein